MNRTELEIRKAIVDYIELYPKTLLYEITVGNPNKIIATIAEEIDRFKEIGDYKEIVRIVIEADKFVFLQSKDNGDPIIYIINDLYKYKKELIDDLSVFCQENDLIYTKI